MNKFAIVLLALTAISAPAFANDTRDVRTTIGYSGSYPELSSENAAFANQPSASMIRKHKGLSDAMQRDAIRSDEKNGSHISVN
jgi:hypothetical protein